MDTTLNKIREHEPCKDGWEKLLTHLGKTQADGEPLAFATILASNGIKDAVWCLRTIPYRDQCLFSAEVAESVLPPDNPAARNVIQSIRDWHAGKISKADLTAAAYASYDIDYDEADADDADDATYVAAVNAADACAGGDADAYTAAVAAADAAVAADPAADADAYAAVHPDADAYTAAVAAADAAADTRKEKWNEIERVFSKYFC